MREQGRRSGQGRRERRRGGGSGRREQVALDGPTDRLVTERDAVPSRSTTNPCSTASARPAGRSASRTPSPRRGRSTIAAAGPSVSVSYASATSASCWAVERQAGRRHQPQDAAALRRPGRQPGDDQLLERAAQRGARQFAARRQQFLGDQRQATRPLHDQQQQARRGAFAFDPLDQGAPGRRGRAAAASAAPADAARPRWPARSLDHGSSRGTMSGWSVAMIARRWSRAIRERKRDERPGRGIGAVEVLEDERDRPSLAEPAEHAQDGFEGPRLASLGRAGDALDRLAEPHRRARAAAGRRRAAAGPRTVSSAGIVECAQGRADRPDDRGVRDRRRRTARRRRAGSSIGSDSSATRVTPSSRNRLTPTPAVPPRMQRPRAAAAASSSTAASRANATSRPTNRALV